MLSSIGRSPPGEGRELHARHQLAAADQRAQALEVHGRSRSDPLGQEQLHHALGLGDVHRILVEKRGGRDRDLWVALDRIGRAKRGVPRRLRERLDSSPLAVLSTSAPSGPAPSPRRRARGAVARTRPDLRRRRGRRAPIRARTSRGPHASRGIRRRGDRFLGQADSPERERGVRDHAKSRVVERLRERGRRRAGREADREEAARRDLAHVHVVMGEEGGETRRRGRARGASAIA